MQIGLIAAMTVVALGASADRNVWQDGTPSAVPMTGYDDFMRLPADQRRDRFTAITAENKALISMVRGPMARWTSGKRRSRRS